MNAIAVLRDDRRKGGRQRTVGEEMVAIVEMAASHGRVATELGGVGDEHGRARIGDDGLARLDFIDMEIQQRAVLIDSADAEDAVVGAKAREEACGGFADDVPIERAERTAGDR